MINGSKAAIVLGGSLFFFKMGLNYELLCAAYILRCVKVLPRSDKKLFGTTMLRKVGVKSRKSFKFWAILLFDNEETNGQISKWVMPFVWQNLTAWNATKFSLLLTEISFWTFPYIQYQSKDDKESGKQP